MKKITLLALLMAGALCASAATPISKHVTKVQNVAKGEVVARIAAPGTVSTTYTVIKTRDVAPEGFSNVTLAAGDVWQDGSGYQMLLDADANTYGTVIPETGGLTTSGDASAETYAEFEYKIPENADGSLSTTNIILDAQATIQIPAGTYDWCITNPTPGDRMWIASANGNVPGRYDDFVFESGASYIFTVSLGGSNDRVDLEIEDPNAPTTPTELAVEPGSTDAEVTWTAGNNNDVFNLRYREWTDPASMSMLWDLPLDGYEAQIADWMVYDADGDGNGWGLAYTDDAQTDLCFTSASYSGGALSPDNWLFTPEVPLGGTLKFKAWQRSSSFPDKIQLYICTNPEWESIDEFEELTSDFIQPSGTTAEEFEINLSAYEGMGIIAFRHYDCVDQWAIYLDDIEVIPANPAEPAEWTVVEDVESPYTIDGLTPETKYEVQVQGGFVEEAKAERFSDWSESVLFTTLPEGAVVNPVYYVVGGFNGWNEDEGVEIGEEGATISVEAQGENDTNQEFKLITADVADGEGWIWLGGADDNGVGYFAITEELLGGEISLDTPGANFRLPEAGTYTINLVKVPIKAHVEGIKMVVTKESATAIENIKSDVKGDNNYYNLMGQKMNGNNLPAGIYIHNGKKIVVK